MQTTIVTGFSGEGYKEYGKRFLDSFHKHNPGFPLHIYTTGVERLSSPTPYKFEQFNQWDIEQLDIFCGTWEDSGVDGKPGGRAELKPKEIKAGYSYRYDAMKFCKMVYTMYAAAQNIGQGLMVWLDGDTVVRKDIPQDLAERALCGEDYAYLGREPKHTETGFLVFRLPEALPILQEWANFYTSGGFILQKEWHSAYLFDCAREKHTDIKGHNLTPGGKGHVIHKCFVGEYFDHLKGARKGMLKSPEAKPIGYHENKSGRSPERKR